MCFAFHVFCCFPCVLYVFCLSCVLYVFCLPCVLLFSMCFVVEAEGRPVFLLLALTVSNKVGFYLEKIKSNLNMRSMLPS